MGEKFLIIILPSLCWCDSLEIWAEVSRRFAFAVGVWKIGTRFFAVFGFVYSKTGILFAIVISWSHRQQ